MNQASKIETSRRVLRPETSQAYRILAILDAAGLDFMVEQLPGGRWRVETEGRGGVDGYSCLGDSLVDALGQLTTVLATSDELQAVLAEVDEQVDQASEVVDADAPIGYTLESPIEFAQPVRFDDPDDYRAYMACELGGNFLEAIAE